MIVELHTDDFEEMVTMYVQSKWVTGWQVNWSDIAEDSDGNDRVRFELIKSES